MEKKINNMKVEYVDRDESKMSIYFEVDANDFIEDILIDDIVGTHWVDSTPLPTYETVSRGVEWQLENSSDDALLEMALDYIAKQLFERKQ